MKAEKDSFLFLFLFLFVLFLFSVGTAHAGQASLFWTPPATNTDGTPLTDLAGYVVYYGTESGNYSQNINVGNVTTFTVSNLADGSYYFAVAAYDLSGNQSAYSNEMNTTLEMNKTLGTQPFVDIQPDFWAAGYINVMFSNGVTTGCGNGKFCPFDDVTRGQMAAFVIRARYGENFSYTQTPYFSDVQRTNAFFKYVQRLKDDGITKASDVFGIDYAITRAQAAAFIVRSKCGDSFTYTMAPYFIDVPSDDAYFPYVQKMKDDGITTMVGIFLPQGAVTRADMSALIARAFFQMR